MVLHDKTEHLFTFNLSHFQKLIEKQLKDEASQFIRIGKSLIINRDYIYRINLTKQQLVMSDMALNQAFMLSASKEALKQLKQLLEDELK
jgi:DNA-binding LytR/AlgR family response regulator